MNIRPVAHKIIATKEPQANNHSNTFSEMVREGFFEQLQTMNDEMQKSQ